MTCSVILGVPVTLISILIDHAIDVNRSSVFASLAMSLTLFGSYDCFVLPHIVSGVLHIGNTFFCNL